MATGSECIFGYDMVRQVNEFPRMIAIVQCVKPKRTCLNAVQHRIGNFNKSLHLRVQSVGGPSKPSFLAACRCWEMSCGISA